MFRTATYRTLLNTFFTTALLIVSGSGGAEASTLIVEDFETPDVSITTSLGPVFFTPTGLAVTSSADIWVTESDSAAYTGSQSINASGDPITFVFNSPVVPVSIDLDAFTASSTEILAMLLDENSSTNFQFFSTDTPGDLETWSFDTSALSSGITQIQFVSNHIFTSYDNLTFDTDISSIPEPSSAMLVMASSGLLFLRRRRRENHTKPVRNSSAVVMAGLIAVVGTMATAPQQASASTIITEDFETPDITATTTVSTPYISASGLIFSLDFGNLWIADESDPEFSDGSQQLTRNSPSSDLTITYADAPAFIPVAYQVDNPILTGSFSTLTSTFVTVSGAIETHTASIDGVDGLQSISVLAPSEAVVSWTFEGSGLSFTFDNIQITPVPEPASLSLLACGGVLMLRRQSRRRVA